MWLLLACRVPTPADPPAPSDPTDPAPVDTDSALPEDSGPPPVDSAPVPIDCAAIPRPPFEPVWHDALPVHEDFAFDGDGHLVAHGGTGFVKVGYPPSVPTLFAPTSGGRGGPASIRALPDGDFVYDNVDTRSVYRIDGATGAETLLADGFNYANGIEIATSSGTVWVLVADMYGAGIVRIDPVTGDQQLALAIDVPNGLSLSPDGGLLYVGTRDGGIYAAPMGPDAIATGPATLFAPTLELEMLGLGVDACGNVYGIAENGNVWRWAPEGGVPERILADGAWFTNLQWGSGIGGWSATHLFVNDRTAQRYAELDLGIGEKPR